MYDQEDVVHHVVALRRRDAQVTCATMHEVAVRAIDVRQFPLPRTRVDVERGAHHLRVFPGSGSIRVAPGKIHENLNSRPSKPRMRTAPSLWIDSRFSTTKRGRNTGTAA